MKPRTERPAPFDPAKVPYRGASRTKRCPGPNVWWCGVEGCTTEHPPKPEPAPLPQLVCGGCGLTGTRDTFGFISVRRCPQCRSYDVTAADG